MTKELWSKPYCGIIHYLGQSFPVHKAIIIYNDSIYAYRLDLNSLHPFTTAGDKWFKKDELEKAKKWLIRQ